MLLPFSIRGLPFFDRPRSGSEGHGAGGGHDVENVRHDGVARGVRPGAHGADRRYDEIAEPLDVESDFDLPKGGGGSHARAAGFGEKNAGSVPHTAGSPPPPPSDPTLP